jgi:DNA-binding NarL/FixJ family response regulator
MSATATKVSHGTIVVAEDDVLLREGIASLLTGVGFEVIGQAEDARELLELVRACPPDVVVLDIRMPPDYSIEGLDAARVIRQEWPEVAILLLSAHVEVEHALELLAGGGRIGYLLKSRVTNVSRLVDTIEQIAAGDSVLDPVLVQELIDWRRRDDPVRKLSPREREVLALMAEGLSNAGISRRLSIAEGSVEKHVGSILSKLKLEETEDVHRRVLAVVKFLESR